MPIDPIGNRTDDLLVASRTLHNQAIQLAVLGSSDNQSVVVVAESSIRTRHRETWHRDCAPCNQWRIQAFASPLDPSPRFSLLFVSSLNNQLCKKRTYWRAIWKKSLQLNKRNISNLPPPLNFAVIDSCLVWLRVKRPLFALRPTSSFVATHRHKDHLTV